MGKIVRELIEYNGINTPCNVNSNFKQLSISHKYMISEGVPYIKQLIRICADSNIYDYKIFNTPVGKSFEGQILTGKKICIDGEIKIKYEYIVLERDNSIYSVNDNVPFCDCIVLPDKFNELSVLYPSIYIEDIQCKRISKKTIFTGISLLLNVEIC